MIITKESIYNCYCFLLDQINTTGGDIGISGKSDDQQNHIYNTEHNVIGMQRKTNHLLDYEAKFLSILKFWPFFFRFFFISDDQVDVVEQTLHAVCHV